MTIGSNETVYRDGMQARCMVWNSNVCESPEIFVNGEFYRVYGNHMTNNYGYACGRQTLAQIFCAIATGDRSIVSETETMRTLNNHVVSDYRLTPRFGGHDGCSEVGHTHLDFRQPHHLREHTTTTRLSTPSRWGLMEDPCHGRRLLLRHARRYDFFLDGLPGRTC